MFGLETIESEHFYRLVVGAWTAVAIVISSAVMVYTYRILMAHGYQMAFVAAMLGLMALGMYGVGTVVLALYGMLSS